jgi:hypothetical protein
MCKNKLSSKDSGFLGYHAVSWVTVVWKHQEPLSRHSVTFQKTQILSNMAVKTSSLQLLSTSSNFSHCHSFPIPTLCNSFSLCPLYFRSFHTFMLHVSCSQHVF